MIKFHVLKKEEMGIALFKGEQSVRKPPSMKPLMLFSQDESVFNQFLLKPRQWVGLQGQRPLLPKTDGISFMLSAIQSRELDSVFTPVVFKWMKSKSVIEVRTMLILMQR